MTRFKQQGEAVTPINEAVVDGGLVAVPAGTTNGAALTGRPVGATGVLIYLPSGSTITYTIATTAPTSAPSLTLTATDADKVIYEPLGPETGIYITSRTGAPIYRWL